MFDKPLREIMVSDLQQLVTDREPESIRLEYKRQLNLASDSDKKEAAKDASAFAHSIGGLIIYGVDEVNVNGRAVAGALTPLHDPSVESRLVNVLASRITPPALVEVLWVPEGNGAGGFLLVRVAPSEWSLHMVDGRYYKRLENGAHPMTEQEVGARYAAIERMKHLGADRLSEVVRHEVGDVDDRTAPADWFGVIVIPLTTVAESVDVKAVEREWLADTPGIKPIVDPYRVTVSGRGLEEMIPEGASRADTAMLVRLRRDGVLHCGTADLRFQQAVGGSLKLADMRMVRYLVFTARLAGTLYRRLGIRGPFQIAVVLRTSKTLRVYADLDEVRPTRDLPPTNLVLPYQPPPDGFGDGLAFARRMLDRVFQEVGFNSSRFFASDGTLDQGIKLI